MSFSNRIRALTLSRWLYACALLLLLVGCVDAALYYTTSMGRWRASLAAVAVPETVKMELAEAGSYTVFLESQVDVTAPATAGRFLSALQLTLTAQTTSLQIPLPRTPESLEYAWNGRSGIAAFRFVIAKPGTYELSTWYPNRQSGRLILLAVGHNAGERLARVHRAALADLLAWAAVGAFLAGMAFFRRRQAFRPPRATTENREDASAPDEHSLAFHGSPRELFDIYILNLLKTVLTLGIYSFWAKVKTLKYLWGNTEFAGDRFAFHGTGKELFLGWLKAITIFGGLAALGWLIPLAWASPLAEVLAKGLASTGFVALFPVALLGSMRYRLSRSSWRGIRFSFHGEYRPFLRLWLRGLLLSILTVGFYYPFYQTDMRRFMVEHTRLGSSPFKFDGCGKDLVRAFVITYLLTLPTLGMVWLWYTAYRRRYFWDHTTFDGARFHCTVTGEGLLSLSAANLALLIFTLGLALPWVTVPTKRYDLDNLVLRGPVDFNRIMQQAQAATSTGEGLAGLLNVDALTG